MNRRARFIARFGPFVVLTIGMIAFSQGLSFGRWNSFQTAQQNHDLHAILLALMGLALLIAGLVFHQISERLRELERPRDSKSS